jgi:hypothetical protein
MHFFCRRIQQKPRFLISNFAFEREGVFIPLARLRESAVAIVRRLLTHGGNVYYLESGLRVRGLGLFLF